jgi:hypothetical protein
VIEAARITDARSRLGDAHLERLRAVLGDRTMVQVPELLTRATGRRVVALVADALDQELPEAG